MRLVLHTNHHSCLYVLITSQWLLLLPWGLYICNFMQSMKPLKPSEGFLSSVKTFDFTGAPIFRKYNHSATGCINCSTFKSIFLNVNITYNMKKHSKIFASKHLWAEKAFILRHALYLRRLGVFKRSVLLCLLNAWGRTILTNASSTLNAMEWLRNACIDRIASSVVRCENRRYIFWKQS